MVDALQQINVGLLAVHQYERFGDQLPRVLSQLGRSWSVAVHPGPTRLEELLARLPQQLTGLLDGLRIRLREERAFAGRSDIHEAVYGGLGIQDDRLGQLRIDDQGQLDVLRLRLREAGLLTARREASRQQDRQQQVDCSILHFHTLL